ncbi:hypothetical protein EJ05DRAFT_32206 [Pseudovirgaria hyperparasitica]|uniref:polynucleotide adenylyltransferase n=1 Tax=Pseudovirgaria hyperparasitica TaxID=470096 RepID=A0A6A6WM83_9PEZI|nr:uncharacterized protein EJ05DRAFT_32206 [Pseudovirgaria hyperparasitica]KAF2763263.1 hypothetical protein EJ05DRAFT_32206 [Pseudovirgaria hyperparasitica]
MTSREGPAMSTLRNELPLQPLRRSAQVSQPSSSVPTTPFQHPRARSRSPSPRATLGGHSPRSVTSETNGPLPSLRKPRASGCRYETGGVSSRRRIPYNIGDAPLDKIENVKQHLSPDEDKKLTADMKELYDRLLPTQESERSRSKLVQKLEHILKTEWPAEDFKVHVFGSSGNMLYTSDSDVDICIQTPMKALEKMHYLADALARHGMDRVVCVPSAKVPIVKIWDPELLLSCDMNVNNTLALSNTRMIKTYVQIDERVRPLAMIIKHWTKQRILNDAALGGTLSSYTWICMILNFLQTRDPPILPSLHNIAGHRKLTSDGTQSEFADDLDALRGSGKSNKETLGQLLFHFFRLYGHELDYETSVISVRNGRLLSRREKKWHVDDRVKEGRDRLCVEEPFNVSRNLGNSADDTAFRGIHEEIRRAFDCLANGGRLTEACEQYEYPTENPQYTEENGIFKKPSATKAILTSTTPTSTRGGRGGSGSKARGVSSRQGTHMYGRRASSAASFGNNRPPFLQSPSLGPQEYVNDLHKQLYHQYQLLEQQKAQLYAQTHAGAHHAQLQAHLQAQAQAHAQIMAQSQGRTHSVSGSPQMSGYTSGMTSPRMSDNGPATAPLFHGYLYHYPRTLEQMASAASPDGSSRTNPSSPSLAATMPYLRRTVHRSSAASDTPAASVRSHSQPARVFPPSHAIPGYPIPAIPPEYLSQPRYDLHQMQHPLQEAAPQQPTSAELPHQPLNTSTNLPQPVQPADRGIPKEYLGYYIGESPKPQDFTVQPIPSWSEIEGRQRQRRIIPEHHTSSLFPSSLKYSRSPSPLGSHFRSFSTSEGLGLTPTGAARPGKADRLGSVQPNPENGLLIVNGSYDPGRVIPSRDEVESSRSATTLSDTSPSDSVFPLELPEPRQKQLQANELLQRRDIGDHSTRNGASANSMASPRWKDSNGDAETMNRSGTREVQSQRHHQPTEGIQAIEIPKSRESFLHEPKSAGLGPLLSPVLETRTPSPTASRALETRSSSQVKPLLHAVPNGKTNSEHRPIALPPKSSTDSKQSQKAALPRITTDTNQFETNGLPNSASTPQSGVWQKTGSKKRLKKKNGGAKANGEASKGYGEPLPVNEADRKGG